MIDADEYPTLTFWSAEDDGFIAVAIDLPGCSAFGETKEEALAQISVAIPAWIKACRAAGNPVPAPRSQPRVDTAQVYEPGHRPIVVYAGPLTWVPL